MYVYWEEYSQLTIFFRGVAKNHQPEIVRFIASPQELPVETVEAGPVVEVVDVVDVIYKYL